MLEGHSKSVNSISQSPSGRLLATGSSDGTVRVWSFPEGKTIRVLPKQVTALFSPDGDHLATVSSTSRVHLWKPEGAREGMTLPALDRRITALAFTADGSMLLAGGTGPIHLLRLDEGRKEGALEGHRGIVACLRFSPDGSTLASTGADGTLRFWCAGDWSQRRSVPLRAGGIFQIAFFPAGKSIAVSADRMIQTISLESGEVVDRIELPLKGIYGVAVSPDGRYLANAAADGKIRIWELG